MDWVLLTIGGFLMITGIIGAFLPIIPGPAVSYGGLMLLNFTDWPDFSTMFMVVLGLLTVIVTLVDYYVPVWGTRKLGGSPAGVRGSLIGLILGIFFFPPFGMIIGPLVGGVIAELIVNRHDFTIALRTGLGSLAGFMLGTGLKLASSLVMGFYFVDVFI